MSAPRDLVPAREDDGCAEQAQSWFERLRDRICAAFEAIEDDAAGTGAAGLAPGRFERRPWERPGGGGGVMALMRGR